MWVILLSAVAAAVAGQTPAPPPVGLELDPRIPGSLTLTPKSPGSLNLLPN